MEVRKAGEATKKSKVANRNLVQLCQLTRLDFKFFQAVIEAIEETGKTPQFNWVERTATKVRGLHPLLFERFRPGAYCSCFFRV